MRSLVVTGPFRTCGGDPRPYARLIDEFELYVYFGAFSLASFAFKLYSHN